MTSKDKELLISGVQTQCKVLEQSLRIEDTLTVATANQVKANAALVFETAARQLRDDTRS